MGKLSYLNWCWLKLFLARSHRKPEMEFQEELNRFMLCQSRENDKHWQLWQFIISVWNTGRCHTLLLWYYQHIWKEIGVRVYQRVLASMRYEGFCVVHLSGEDMRWNSFQHLSKHHAGLHRNRSITNCISIAALIFQTFCSSKQRAPQADCC